MMNVKGFYAFKIKVCNSYYAVDEMRSLTI